MNQIHKFETRFHLEYDPGEIVLGRPIHKNRVSQKVRPLIIVADLGCRYEVVQLTTQREAKHSDYYRIPIPWPVGDPRYSYIWGPDLYCLNRIDVEKHIDWLDRSSLEIILASVCIPKKYERDLVSNVWRESRSDSITTA